MAKAKQTTFVCQECGYDSPQWLGKCPECGNWNTFKEFRSAKQSASSTPATLALCTDSTPKKLGEIAKKESKRISTNFAEMNTVLGGGLVLGSATLLAGDPGIGKSTLLLQVCINIASQGETVLYISGEESVEQIKLRADRLHVSDNAREHLLLMSMSDPDRAVELIEEFKPALVIVDSVQTMQADHAGGLAGSVSQVRYGAMHFIRTAKRLQIPTILVGHVTKEGMVAGPMVLSHMVDTVLFLEGEKLTRTRLLRSLKNRFGPVDEVGIFTMSEKGMEEVTNPEQIFLTQQREHVPGTVLVVTMEGSRAFLVELQALVVSSRLAMPRRVVSGIDQRRVEILLAVLQKHARLPVDSMDVFVNVAGGLKLADPAIDLGICLAIFSSLKNIPLSKTVGIGEVGLLGELRSVAEMEKRVKEAKKLGLKDVVTPKTHQTLNQVIASLKG